MWRFRDAKHTHTHTMLAATARALPRVAAPAPRSCPFLLMAGPNLSPEGLAAMLPMCPAFQRSAAAPHPVPNITPSKPMVCGACLACTALCSIQCGV